MTHVPPTVYAKAAKQVIDLTAEDVSEAKEDDTYEAENLVDEDGDFNLDVDLESPLLSGMLSDRRPAPGPENATNLTITPAHIETRDHEPTEDDWETLRDQSWAMYF